MQLDIPLQENKTVPFKQREMKSASPNLNLLNSEDSNKTGERERRGGGGLLKVLWLIIYIYSSWGVEDFAQLFCSNIILG